ncbi:MAG: amino acid permease [Acidobacteriota bacterium]|nr:amino acid permease [Acidobacteriota bacterium]
MVLVIANVVPLLVLVAAGLTAASREVALAQAATGEGGLGQAALLLLFAHAGLENTAAPVGEFKNPRRDVPFALLTQIGLVTFLYAAVQRVALGNLRRE